MTRANKAYNKNSLNQLLRNHEIPSKPDCLKDEIETEVDFLKVKISKFCNHFLKFSTSPTFISVEKMSKTKSSAQSRRNKVYLLP